jgi:hypothetical protein
MQSAYDVGLIVRDQDSSLHRFKLTQNLGCRCRHESNLPTLRPGVQFAG